MQKIIALPITLESFQSFNLPMGVKILTVRDQKLYVLLDDTEKMRETKYICVFMTEEPVLGEVHRYLSSITVDGFDYHIFEGVE